METKTLSAGEKQFSEMSEGQLLYNYSQLVSCHFRGNTIEEVSRTYFKYIPVFPSIYYKNPKRFKIQNFYRATRYGGLMPQYVHQISYPDTRREVQVNRNRANWENYPVLYGCSGGAGALKEIHAEEGDVITLTKWKFDVSELNAGFLAGKMKSPKPDFNMLRDTLTERFCKKDSGVFDHKRKLLLDFWNDLFLAPDNSISAFMCWALMFGHGVSKWDYIVYPSIAEDLRVINYALHPKLIDFKKAYPEKSIAFYFHSNFGQSKPIAIGYPHGDKIIWSGKIDDIKADGPEF